MSAPKPMGRGASRRSAIVSEAAELFSRNGYAAVGMDDIGAAVGVTGPAIYRHFESKAAVLAAVFEGIIDTVVTAPAGSGSDPVHRLRAAVSRYALGVVAARRAMAVFVREVHHLPNEVSGRLRSRQRTLVHHWRELVAAVHLDWSAEQTRTAVHAAFGLLNSVGTFTSPLSDGELADQLIRLTLGALDCP
ncbi:MAG: TetR/AcrR family transcriptional regulator [Actinomycetota bacterium]|nr:TetR/AcrR family transcriptional regulator [Actinomycetota bacterium]